MMVNVFDIDATVHAAVLEHNATELFDDVDMEEIFKGDSREGAKLIAAYHSMSGAYSILRNNYEKGIREAQAKGEALAVHAIAEQGDGHAWDIRRPATPGQPMIGAHKPD